MSDSKNLNTIRPFSNHKMMEEYESLRDTDAARDENFSPLHDSILGAVCNLIKLYGNEEAYNQLWTASLFPERITKACLRLFEQHLDRAPSLLSELKQLWEENERLKKHLKVMIEGYENVSKRLLISYGVSEETAQESVNFLSIQDAKQVLNK